MLRTLPALGLHAANTGEIARVMVYSSQNPSTDNGQFRVSVLRYAWGVYHRCNRHQLAPVVNVRYEDAKTQDGQEGNTDRRSSRGMTTVSCALPSSSDSCPPLLSKLPWHAQPIRFGHTFTGELRS